MIKYLLDSNLSAKITLLYSTRSAQDIVFEEIFDEAARKFDLKAVYTITENVPDSWPGRTGYIDEAVIRAEVPDYQNRLFYISGPEPMVEAFEKLVAGMGVKLSNIKRDYFPGYTDTHRPV